MTRKEYEIKEFYGKEALGYKKLCAVMFRGENRGLKNEDADIEMDINAFSSAIFGRFSLKDLEIFDSVRINRNRENLEKVFYLKELWTEDHF